MRENKKIGQVLRAARVVKKLSQEDIGRYLNKSKSTISAYERGKRSISVTNLKKLCILLDINSNQFFLPSKFAERKL